MNPCNLSVSVATEQRVIACELALGSAALLTVIEHGITPASFSHALSRRIHERILLQHAAGLPFELHFIWEQLTLSPEETSTLMAMTGANNEGVMNLPRLDRSYAGGA